MHLAHWSIAQTKNRETKPEGLGWELFKNYLIARDKFKPNYFLYENNKSMSSAIRNQITSELGVEPIMINSALVSAQNRQRLYWTNIPSVTQPQDRGILLRDILESGVCWNEKSYCITATEYKGSSLEHTLHKHVRTQIAEPIRIGTIENAAKNKKFDSQQYRIYSPDGKSVTICGQGGGIGAKTGLYAVPIETPACLRYERTDQAKALRKQYEAGEIRHGYHEFHELHPRPDGKSNTLTTVLKDNMIIENAHDKVYPVYEVKDGQITIKDKTYPINLSDGLYIIRKLTVTECKRLQTVPDEYVFPVSNTQAYKMLGNGWTVDVIVHILSHINYINENPLDVLSMYDGMSCGQIALQKMGCDIRNYWATEIDKFAIKTAQHNFPNTIQLGDAFQVRDLSWRI